MLSKIIGFSNHAVIVAEEQHQTIQTYMKLETAMKGNPKQHSQRK
jgi:hypothetical protein